MPNLIRPPGTVFFTNSLILVTESLECSTVSNRKRTPNDSDFAPLPPSIIKLILHHNVITDLSPCSPTLPSTPTTPSTSASTPSTAPATPATSCNCFPWTSASFMIAYWIDPATNIPAKAPSGSTSARLPLHPEGKPRSGDSDDSKAKADPNRFSGILELHGHGIRAILLKSAGRSKGALLRRNILTCLGCRRHTPLLVGSGATLVECVGQNCRTAEMTTPAPKVEDCSGPGTGLSDCDVLNPSQLLTRISGTTEPVIHACRKYTVRTGR